MDRKRQKLTLEKNDVQKECQDEKITALERKLEYMENKLKLVIAELEQVKEERACDKINFETEKCELESKIDKYKEQCTEFQSENGKLQNENGKLQSENGILQNENGKLQNENGKLQSENGILQNENGKLQNENGKLQSENGILQNENGILQNENGKLQNENGKLQNENEKLQGENKRLQNYLQDLESANINVEEKSQIYNTDLNSQITKINESNDDALDFNSLPNEIILNVFAYFEQNQLGQIARVCRRWNLLSKSPVLWKKVNVKFSPSHRFQTAVAASFIKGLPTCVTSIRLNFMGYRRWIGTLDFAQFCVKLQEKCPHLETLMLTNSRLSNNLPAVINICSQFLQDVKNLIFHHSEFSCDCSTNECSDISKIEILELNNCYFVNSYKPPLPKIPHLKKLHLCGIILLNSWFLNDTSFLNQLHVLNLSCSDISSTVFSKIQNHGHNLKELYSCSGFIGDHDLNFNNSVFPHLKTICLSRTYVTCEGVVSLIQSCPCLENVYVKKRVAESFAVHPYVVANRCKSGIVKAIDDIYKHNVGYSCT